MAKMIQIRNVPDGIHRKLKARAALEGQSLSDFLLDHVRRLSSLPSARELEDRLRAAEPFAMDDSSASIIRRARDSR